MKRKVIQLSVSTLVVSLPSEWVEKNNISKGSEVEVINKGDKLIVRSGEKPQNKIILDTKGRIFDKRYLGDLYIRGYDEVRINFKDADVLKEIKKEQLREYEIVEEEKDFCIIKSVSVGLESEFDNMLRKCFLLTKEMSKSLVDYFNGEKVELAEIRKLELENNKLSGFCLRLLNKNGYTPAHKTTFLYVITREIEAICDIYKYVIDEVLEGYKISTEEKEYFSLVNDFFVMFYELFYKYDKERFKEFYNQRKKLIQTGKRLEGKLAHHSLNLVVAIYNICGPYLTMNMEEIY
ncbi:AbrB/MazE/SpoVT family DNA-binding domain-containing protein [Candidatus Woesearchaeota archaeon]|jgi:phosphate uptake regulator|nr:AbrB/MazE/SpoVT family DNA-binding domain-containing protein [Candidatus Woesearchaeota archaeon]MBT4368656.1 AbrB/MazE/SpoVT family DNA-binding domain-containing protein [Candidatus Woesearchaeota archaeon]MBT4712211.1 AbrB/MazE/SpoVT family DNA-binding domain-containing protein [Candidatus Woesearchaeota archaeon]MBT6638957.1 AbrB/MazE/SpoVT family DNA-binding domain-containing protein [Candidatus Woesearchaeota archaeon]MBT7134141.1 AbrB/MazE/SpoVT family DNA-binding domain-containing pro